MECPLVPHFGREPRANVAGRNAGYRHARVRRDPAVELGRCDWIRLSRLRAVLSREPRGCPAVCFGHGVARREVL